MPRGTGLTDGPARLLVDNRDVCAVEVAASGPARRHGLLGRTGLDGAIWLTPAASVHTIGMQFPIDVAFVDRSMRVRKVVTMPPGRLGLPRLRAKHIVETAAGACERWGITRGVTLSVETT